MPKPHRFSDQELHDLSKSHVKLPKEQKDVTQTGGTISADLENFDKLQEILDDMIE